MRIPKKRKKSETLPVVRVPEEIDIPAIRLRLGMSQAEFAAHFGFSVNTLHHWEQKQRRPEGASRAYLHVISRIPEAVLKALEENDE